MAHAAISLRLLRCLRLSKLLRVFSHLGVLRHYLKGVSWGDAEVAQRSEVRA